MRQLWRYTLPLPLFSGKELVVDEDEEYKRVDFDKIKMLKSAFQGEGN